MTKFWIIRVTLLAISIWFGAQAFAYDFESRGLYYTITSEYIDPSVRVAPKGNYGRNDYCQGVVEIPEVVNYRGKTYKVVEIGNSAFRGCEHLTEVYISRNVTAISREAFGDCRALKYVDMGPSVKYVDPYAFYDCRQLEEVTFSENLVKIGEKAFKNCYSLDRVVIPRTARSIEEEAFSGCSRLRSFQLLNPNTDIKPNAFKDTSVQVITGNYGRHGYENHHQGLSEPSPAVSRSSRRLF